MSLLRYAESASAAASKPRATIPVRARTTATVHPGPPDRAEHLKERYDARVTVGDAVRKLGRDRCDRKSWQVHRWGSVLRYTISEGCDETAMGDACVPCPHLDYGLNA